MAIDSATMAPSVDVASNLLQKLSELDRRVHEYRLDMAEEFRRYSSDLLHNSPSHVISDVEKAIADSAQKYPALIHPPVNSQSLLRGRAHTSKSMEARHRDKPTGAESKPRCSSGSRSPPPVLPHTSGTPPDSGLRSPHERELEFHGLFTPSYLPLLDAVQRHFGPASPVSPPPNTLVNTSEPNKPQGESEGDNRGDGSPTTVSYATGRPPNSSASISSAPIALSRPDPARRPTQDTISTIASDDSFLPPRRSALRRTSSSSTKTQSPRRVRFDVEGEEVLPTASPLLSPRVEFPTSPLRPITATNGLLSDESPEQDSTDPDVSLLGSSPPRPKKITSTDRLKAMTRNSTEDTSQWKTVGTSNASDEDEDELVMGSLSRRKRTSNPPQDPPAHVTRQPQAVSQKFSDPGLPTELKSQPVPAIKEIHDNSDDSEDEDMLMMPPLSSFKNKKKFSPPKSNATMESTKPTSSSMPQQTKTPDTRNDVTLTPPEEIKDAATEEDMFDFDEDQGSEVAEKLPNNKNKPVAKYIQEEDEVDETPEKTGAPASDLKTATNIYSASPGISIPKPPIEKPGTTDPAPAPAMPQSPTARNHSASVGSYRGKPFTIGSIRNEDLHERAAKMGDVFSFVGSVDGRTGIDEKGSYRPTVGSFTGTPKSLSERLMKEEQEEEARTTAAKAH